MNHQTFGGFSRLYFRYVIISKSDEARAEQQARLIAMPSRESSSALAKERSFLLLINFVELRFLIFNWVSYLL